MFMMKYYRAGQVTDDRGRMHFAYWIAEATDTYSQYEIPLFHGHRGYANAPQCNVIRTLPVLCHIEKSHYRFLKCSYRVDE